MLINQLSIDDALASLGSDRRGLTPAETVRRLGEYGPNRLAEIRREPSMLILFREFTTSFSVLLWIAAALSFFAEWKEPGHGMDRLAVAIVLIIVVSGVFSFLQEFRAERMLAAMRRLLPQQVAVRRAGEVMQVPHDTLVPGDIVLLGQGDSVPADCRIIEAFGARVNNASITGESVPQPRDAQPSAETGLARSRNVLLAGTSIASGTAAAVVFATGMRTEFGAIAHLAQTSGQALSPLRREVAYLSRVIIVLAIAIGVVFFAIGWFIGIPLWVDVIFAIGIIVAMVPEGLLPTVTLALVLAAQRMARRNVLIRHLPSVEALGSTTVICTDKTGTLTQNRMTVAALVLGNKPLPVETTVRDTSTVVRYEPFFLAAALCHDVKESMRGAKRALLGDPMEIALMDLGRSALPVIPAWPKIDEIPFDGERMRHSVVYATPHGPLHYCKGAPEAVLGLCSQIQTDEGVRELSPELRKSAQDHCEAMAERGLRVIAFAFRRLDDESEQRVVEKDLTFAGLAGLEDPPRPEVAEAVGKCREAGVRVIMVTGDHPRTALAIAREIGLVRSGEARVVTGTELRHSSLVQLQLLLDTPDVIFSRVAADDKLRIVEALKAKRQVVAVTGDGVNDAPALRSAHIGVAMGVSGTDVAKEAADMVLLDDNFASIVVAIEEGRAVFDNIRKFLTYILAHNVPELVPYLALALAKVPLALTPIQILAVDMGTDTLTALGLGVERPEPDVMRRLPRSPDERLLTWGLALRAYLFLGLFEALAVMVCFFITLHGAGWLYGQVLDETNPLYLQSTAVSLGTIIVLQSVNVFLCRSADRSIFTVGIGGNAWILWGVVLEILALFLISYTPVGNEIFGTAAIPAQSWLLMVPFGLALLVLEELRKSVVRRLRA